MKHLNKTRVFEAIKIAFPALLISIPSYSVYSSQCLMLDSAFGESPSEVTKVGANDFAKTVPEEKLSVPEQVTGEFETNLSAEMSESELVTTLDESLLDAEGVAGLIVGCIQEVPQAIKAHEDKYATALDKASADLSCIPIVGQVLGFVDTLLKYEKQNEEIAKVNRLVDKLNSANGLNLDDSHFPEHDSIDNWIVYFKLNSSFIPGELYKTLRSYNKHIKHDQLTKLDSHISLIAEHYAKKFLDDNQGFKNILDKARNKDVTSDELTLLIDEFISAYKDFNDVDVDGYIKATNHVIATNVVNFRRLTKKVGEQKIDSSIDDAVATLNKYINTLLLKIEDVRKYEYELANNLNSKGQSLDSACWSGGNYVCEYFNYMRDNDYGVGGWVQRKNEIYDYTDSNTVPSMQTQWQNLSADLQANRDEIESEMYSKVINHTEEIDEYNLSFSSTILSDAGFGDAIKYRSLINDAYVMSMNDDGFGPLNILYNKIFSKIVHAFSNVGDERATKVYASNDTYEYGKVYSKVSHDGNDIWYRYLGENNIPITDLKSNAEWDIIGSNNILLSMNGISKYDIAMNGSKALFEFIGRSTEGVTLPSSKDSDFRGNWNFIGYYDDEPILPASSSVGKVVRFNAHGLKVGDTVARRYMEDNVWKTSYYILTSKNSSGDYSSIPTGNYGNSNWTYLGDRVSLLKSWTYGNERFSPNSDSFQLLFPRYAINKRIHAKQGDFLDSMYLSWTNPTTGATERTHSVGGDGGDYLRYIALDRVYAPITVFFGRSYTSDSIRGIDINYNTLGHRQSGKAVIDSLCNISGITGLAGNMIDRIGFINQCR